MIIKTLLLMCLSFTTNNIDFNNTNWDKVHNTFSTNGSSFNAKIQCKNPKTEILVFRSCGMIGIDISKEIISNNEFRLFRTYTFCIFEDTLEIIVDVTEQKFDPIQDIPEYEYI